jgi:hypothetical protein
VWHGGLTSSGRRWQSGQPWEVGIGGALPCNGTTYMLIVGRRRVDDSDVRRRIVMHTAVTASDPPDAGRIGDRRGNQPRLLATINRGTCKWRWWGIDRLQQDGGIKTLGMNGGRGRGGLGPRLDAGSRSEIAGLAAATSWWRYVRMESDNRRGPPHRSIGRIHRWRTYTETYIQPIPFQGVQGYTVRIPFQRVQYKGTIDMDLRGLT